jgi:hypothetical protein
MKISPVSVNVTSSKSINQTNSNIPTNWADSIKFHESFDYADIEPDLYTRQEVDNITELLRNILHGLVKKSLQLGLNICYSKKKRMGDYVLEARFEPPNKQKNIEACIYLPISNVDNLIAKDFFYNNAGLKEAIEHYVSIVIAQTDNTSLIRLIIIFAHEFGHFISFCHGNHDINLAQGIILMHRGTVLGTDNFTSVVFFEESTAWRYGKEHLQRLNFVWWDVFNRIKFSSLNAYYQKLQLAKASVATHYKLSMLDDFRQSAQSNYFAEPKNN